MPPVVLTPPFSEVPEEDRSKYLQRAFTLFDDEGIGALEISQLLACIKAAGIEITGTQVTGILRELKLRSDGVVDLPLFLKFIQIASRSTEVASQFKANQQISATKKKIINVYVVVLFFLTFALTILYISASSKSRVMLIGIIFLAVLLGISVFYVIIFPLIALRMRRRARVAEAPSPSSPVAIHRPGAMGDGAAITAISDPRFIVFRVTAEMRDLERGAQDDVFSVSAQYDEPEIFTGPSKLGDSQSYRRPQLPAASATGAAAEDVPALLDTADERRNSASGDDALALVPVKSSSPHATKSSFNPLRANRRGR